MKYTILILAGILTSSGAFAKKAEACAKCGEMKQLENEFNALNYFNQADQESGSAKAVKAMEYAEAFAKNAKAKKSSPEEFQAIVTLIAAASPYDAETAGASILSAAIAGSNDLKNGFAGALGAVAEPCRKKDLAVSVEEYLCQFNQAKHLKHGQELDDSCVRKPAFNIEQCLGK